MTVNGVMAVVCVILPNSASLGANYVNVVEDRLILSANDESVVQRI